MVFRPFKYLILSFIFLSVLRGSSQDIDYARDVLYRLTAPAMHGRGYVRHGDLKAAEFIRGEFRKDGLEELSDGYFQPFSLPMNTFPGRISLSVDGKKLEPGTEYLVSCSSPSIKGTFGIARVEGDTVPEHVAPGQFEGKFVVCRGDIKKLALGNPFGSAGIIIPVKTGDNLMWLVSTGSRVQDHVLLLVREDYLPEDAKMLSVDVANKFIPAYKTQNVAAFVKGTSVPDSFIVVSAHYDHLGMMGRKVYFPGANDNGSGTAMMLDLARYYSQPGNTPEYSMLFIAFSAEEAGLVGSTYFAEHPMVPLDRIRFMVNLDMVGNGSEGITVVNATVFEKEFNLMKTINENEKFVADVAPRGESCNSDHCPFYLKGVPSVFIYTRGKEFSEYHNVKDKASDLPLTAYNGLFRLITEFFSELQH